MIVYKYPGGYDHSKWNDNWKNFSHYFMYQQPPVKEIQPIFAL